LGVKKNYEFNKLIQQNMLIFLYRFYFVSYDIFQNSSKEKQEKSIEISKKTISFEFLRDIEELRRFSGINEMFSKLDKWEIKGVKRKMKDVCDAVKKIFNPFYYIII
jgi:hypothetical protein